MNPHLGAAMPGRRMLTLALGQNQGVEGIGRAGLKEEGISFDGLMLEIFETRTCMMLKS